MEKSLSLTQRKVNKTLFTELIPGISRPIPIQFYIPEEFNKKQELIESIESRGGVVIFKPTVLTYQITVLKDLPKDKSILKKIFYDGFVYKHSLIKESIKANKWRKTMYYQIRIKNKVGKKLP